MPFSGCKSRIYGSYNKKINSRYFKFTAVFKIILTEPAFKSPKRRLLQILPAFQAW